MNTNVITPELVSLDVAPGDNPEAVIRYLAGQITEQGRASGVDELAADALAREAKSGTGVPGGVAIPHCRSESVTEPTLAFVRLSEPVDFSGPDGPADLVFLIAAPAGGGKEHMKILTKLARSLVKKDFRAALRGAETPQDIVDVVAERLESKPASSAGATPTPKETEPAPKTESATAVTRIVAITACPTGIAHTYMGADSLTQAADERDDVELVVEPQGSSAGKPVDPAVIQAADAVIFATDVGVRDRERFVGKPVIESGVKRAINEPNKMIDEAVAASKNPNSKKVTGAGGGSSESAEESGAGLGWGTRIRQAVMTGVSYMVPFVAAGGLLLALGFLFGGYQVANVADEVAGTYSLWDLPPDVYMVGGEALDRGGLLLYLGSIFFATGSFGMGVIVAILSAYIAFGLAGRPGIAPGFIGGAIAVAVDAGFLGGLVTGILAGLVAYWIGAIAVPRWLASLMPVVIIPLIASAAVGLVMYLFLGRPLAWLMVSLTDWLSSLSGASAAVLGLILGLMMCSDMGGPINKAAYLFGTAGLAAGTTESMEIMAAVMGAGMVPPLAMALSSTVLRPKLYTEAERENGKAGWLLGASFISEGAIPFAAADPLRVIPAMMLGGATTGAISMALSAGSRAPHGGIFVFFAVENLWAWVLAIVIGTIIAAIAVTVLKAVWKPNISKQTLDAGMGENTTTAPAAA